MYVYIRNLEILVLCQFTDNCVGLATYDILVHRRIGRGGWRRCCLGYGRLWVWLCLSRRLALDRLRELYTIQTQCNTTLWTPLNCNKDTFSFPSSCNRWNKDTSLTLTLYSVPFLVTTYVSHASKRIPLTYPNGSLSLFAHLSCRAPLCRWTPASTHSLLPLPPLSPLSPLLTTSWTGPAVCGICTTRSTHCFFTTKTFSREEYIERWEKILKWHTIDHAYNITAHAVQEFLQKIVKPKILKCEQQV